MPDQLHDISQRLASIAEEIADIEFDQLRASVEGGATKPSAQQKRIARARRSVEKAAQLLSIEEQPSP